MILIWHEGALGDLLLSRLAIACIRERHREEKIALFARQEVRKLFARAGLVDEACPTSLPLLQKKTRQEKIRCLYLFTSTPTFKEILDPFTEKIRLVPTRPGGRLHLALEEALTLGCYPTKGLFLEDKKPAGELVLIHPGSGAAYKCLPAEVWKKLGEDLEKSGKQVLYLLGPAEEKLKTRFPAQKTLSSSEIDTTLNILSKAEAFLGHDSGLSHLAAALGIPTLAIFGPTAWWHWAPFGRVLVGKIPCKCLFQRKNPQNCRKPCLKEVSYRPLQKLVEMFFSTIPRFFRPEEEADTLEGPRNPRKSLVEEGEVPEWKRPEEMVPELGILVAEVEEEHFLKV